jgi:hypothetical protein
LALTIWASSWEEWLRLTLVAAAQSVGRSPSFRGGCLVIWVVATSRRGITSEVADAVAEELRNAGLNVERRDA